MKKATDRNQAAMTESERSGESHISMHDNVDICDDCCSCAAEPYWIEAMKNAEQDKPEKDGK